MSSTLIAQYSLRISFRGVKKKSKQISGWVKFDNQFSNRTLVLNSVTKLCPASLQRFEILYNELMFLFFIRFLGGLGAMWKITSKNRFKMVPRYESQPNANAHKGKQRSALLESPSWGYAKACTSSESLTDSKIHFKFLNFPPNLIF